MPQKQMFRASWRPSPGAGLVPASRVALRVALLAADLKPAAKWLSVELATVRLAMMATIGMLYQHGPIELRLIKCCDQCLRLAR